MIWHPKVERACLHWFFAFHNLSVFIRTHSASAWGPSSCSMSVMLAVYCRCASRSKRGETSETSPMLKCKCLAKMVILLKNKKKIVQLLGKEEKVFWVWSFASKSVCSLWLEPICRLQVQIFRTILTYHIRIVYELYVNCIRIHIGIHMVV